MTRTLNAQLMCLSVPSSPIPAQPPGIPEICKKSLVSCPAEGGLELFIIGKNFLKDTKVVFQRRKVPLGGGGASTSAKPPSLSVIPWEQSVVPDKEYLQQVSSMVGILVGLDF